MIVTATIHFTFKYAPTKKFSFLLLLLAIGCHTTSDDITVLRKDAPDDHFVSSVEAAQIAESAIAQTANAETARAQVTMSSGRNARLMAPGKPKKIKNQVTIDDADDKTKKTATMPVFYIFNYEEGGYSIISADDRLNPILAVVENGVGIEKNSELPGGLILWMQATKEQIQNIRKVKLTAKKKTDKGARIADIVVTQRTPLMLTQWDQGERFNNNIAGGCAGNGGHKLVGCVAVAMGQIIRYWGGVQPEFTTWLGYDWANLPAGVIDPNVGRDATTSETHRLLYDAGDKVGMNWGCDRSSANTANIPNALKSGFGYSSANFSNTYRTVDVIVNLNSDRPVILAGCTQNCNFLSFQYGCGDCHAWVCDGYIRTEMPSTEYCYYDCERQLPECYTCYTSVITYDQFHMNWGWNAPGTNHNGWFSATNFSYDTHTGAPMPFNFTSDLREVVDIHP